MSTSERDQNHDATAHEASDGGHVEVDHEAGLTVITLHGEVDAALGNVLDDLCARAGAAGLPVRVDLSAVTFLESTGASFLVRLTRAVAPHRVTLVKPAPQVVYLLQVTKLVTIFDIVD
ncbi:STAS domain-containing protein [Kineococcus sp. NPDC059986]|uniref:STAS domain-containing protein n=1 Tax=Kineococcus sp. NPDC059986 TaxID=3155538 RepID=UPI00344ED328